jgi:hypothetical protein
MRYLLLKSNTDQYYICRYPNGSTVEFAEVTAAIIPDNPMTVNSFVNQTFYPYTATKFTESVEQKNYDTKTGVIGDPDYYSLKFIESLFPA